MSRRGLAARSEGTGFDAGYSSSDEGSRSAAAPAVFGKFGALMKDQNYQTPVTKVFRFETKPAMKPTYMGNL